MRKGEDRARPGPHIWPNQSLEEEKEIRKGNKGKKKKNEEAHLALNPRLN